jgi:hypothetical protein
MSLQSELALGIFGVLLAITIFSAYRWMQRRRAARIKDWIEAFLMNRCGKLPEHLHIHSTDDQLWPVLASFDYPSSGSHHRLQFACSGAPSNFRLESEKVEQRVSPP